MQSAARRRFLCRLLIYVLGLFILSLGVAVSINSNLGVSPVSSLPYICSQMSGINLSLCTVIVYAVYILLQVVILRREFKIINLGQIIFSFIFSYFIALAQQIVGSFAIPTYPGRLVMLAISIVLIAIGVDLYVTVKLLPMPMEGLSLAVSTKLHLPFPTTKMIIDCIVVGVGIVISLLYFRGLVGIREGTIITAIVTGKVIGLIARPLNPVIQRLCFSPEPAEEAKPAESSPKNAE